MIVAKQVSLVRDVAPETEMTIFTMDVRAAGKGYERYFQRVEALPQVTYCRGLPAAVRESPETQVLRLLTPIGDQAFDLVVLAIGMGPSDGVRELAIRTGIDLDPYGFVLPGRNGPGSTSRPGIFAAGAALAPADVPETVTQAAAAAALAAQILPSIVTPSPHLEGHTGDGSLTDPSLALFPLQWEKKGGLLDHPPRIGLFICTCRDTLAETIDLSALTAWGRQLGNVVHIEQVKRACESSDQTAIEQAVITHDLNRIVVAGCSPRLYGDHFDVLMDRLGLPSRMLARCHVRAGTAQATDVARRELAMAVAGLRQAADTEFAARPLQRPSRRVLVLGGGLAGMTAALTLADLGIDCDLVEREAHLGGNLRQSAYTLEGLDAQELLSDTVARLGQAKTIRVWTETHLASWSGTRGAFVAEFEIGGQRRYERYGALIVATGGQEISPRAYLYGEHPNVITQRQLEARLADPGSARPRSVVMIQCAGSRDEIHPYCSRVCCAQAIKNALALKQHDPAIQIIILFRDIRTLGRHELFYQQARRLGVLFIQYDVDKKPVVSSGPVPDLEPNKLLPSRSQPLARLHVTVWDAVLETEIALTPDLVVLSAGIECHPGNKALAQALGASLDEDSFFVEAHPKLRPTDLAQPGVFVCGLAYGPRFIAESITQARAAALRAALTAVRPPEPRRDIATVVRKLCSFCGLCVAACPYGARVMDEQERVAHVVDHLCQGCGLCVVACPNGASRQPALDPAQLLAMVDAALIE